MKSEAEIRDKIKAFEEAYEHVLSQPLTSIDINAPVALMQVDAVSLLKGLYYVLDEKRPEYRCDKR